MAMRRIAMSSGSPDVTVSFVFKVHTQGDTRITQCKLFIREDKQDAPHLIFWGRSERPATGEWGRHPKTAQRVALSNAFTNYYEWVCDTFEVGTVPGMFNAVLNHRDAIMDVFEENWKKQMKDTHKGRGRRRSRS